MNSSHKKVIRGNTETISFAEHWWEAKEVIRVMPEGRSLSHFFEWLHRHQTGRKRLLDTLLASTFQTAGVSRIITDNAGDLEVPGGFTIVSFQK